MATAAWVMSDPKRFAAAQRAVGAGRLVARDRGGQRTIRSAPWPLSAWTTSRDAPAPPAETFRQWWDRTRGKGSR